MFDPNAQKPSPLRAGYSNLGVRTTSSQDRAILEYCAEAFRKGEELHIPGADQIRGLVANIRQGEMSHNIRELFDPTF